MNQATVKIQQVFSEWCISPRELILVPESDMGKVTSNWCSNPPCKVALRMSIGVFQLTKSLARQVQWLEITNHKRNRDWEVQ